MASSSSDEDYSESSEYEESEDDREAEMSTNYERANSQKKNYRQKRRRNQNDNDNDNNDNNGNNYFEEDDSDDEAERDGERLQEQRTELILKEHGSKKRGRPPFVLYPLRHELNDEQISNWYHRTGWLLSEIIKERMIHLFKMIGPELIDMGRFYLTKMQQLMARRLKKIGSHKSMQAREKKIPKDLPPSVWKLVLLEILGFVRDEPDSEEIHSKYKSISITKITTLEAFFKITKYKIDPLYVLTSTGDYSCIVVSQNHPFHLKFTHDRVTLFFYTGLQHSGTKIITLT